MQKEPEAPEQKKAREAAEKAAAAQKKTEEAAQKAREAKAKEKVDLAASKRETQQKIDAINNAQKGSSRQFTPEEERLLKLHKATVKRLNRQIADIDRELGN